jgi:ferredoxin--NADP+ reductase
MFRILDARFLAPDIKLFRVEAPRVARKQRPGQFVIVRVHGHGERIPLTIAGSDPFDGTIILIVQGVGKTTKLMNRLETGDALRDVVGPLGHPSHIAKFGTVCVVGGGVGIAIAYPVARAMKEAGNRVVSILGARSREYVILEAAVRAVSDETYVTTDDGSYGEPGVVTRRLGAMLDGGWHPDHVLAVGPVPMMRAVADLTRALNIRTIVSTNSIMVDGTGMCGGCRVVISGQNRFACADGPDFDAHQLDFDVLALRNAAYRQMERTALAAFEQHPQRDLEEAHANCRLAAAEAEARLDAQGVG